MIVYPDMLMMVETNQSLWSLPIFVLSDDLDGTDPFIVITKGMESQFGTKTPYMKFMFSEEIVNQKENILVKTYMDYYDVRINGYARNKPARYKETAFMSVSHVMGQHKTHVTVALNRYLIWHCKNNTVAETHIKKALDAMNKHSISKMAGTASLLDINVRSSITTIKDIVTIGSMKNAIVMGKNNINENFNRKGKWES
jgi:hypothetical protein